MICNSLDEVRENIDRIDNNIIKLIAERGGYVAQATKFKKNAQLYGADPDMVEKLYRQMIASFIKKEMSEFNGNQPASLLDNIDRIHTTPMGADRISKNLKLTDTDPVEYCKTKILSPDCHIYKDGKNWYCETDGIKITVNSFSYTIITAHKTQQKIICQST